jgi:hypothetical protein
MAEKISQHQDIFPDVSVTSLVHGEALKRGTNGRIRPPSDLAGTIDAIVNGGRWIVLCPSCSSGLNVSAIDPRFVCAECGSPENAGRWYRVTFPAGREAIEDELLKRPGIKGRVGIYEVAARAWLPGETVEDLQSQREIMFPPKG